MARLRLKSSESLTTGLREVFRSHLAAPAPSEEGPLDREVHRIRTTCKKLRAGLRLVRGALPKGIYRAHNAFYRDNAARLSAMRDAHVQLATLAAIETRVKGRVEFPAVRAALEARVEAEEVALLEQASLLPDIRRQFDNASEMLDDISVSDSFASLRDGLRETYRAGRRAYRAFIEDPTLENHHEWRQQAKYLRYQVTILQPQWPTVMKALATELTTLTEWLGDARDMALLERRAAEDAELAALGPEAEALRIELAKVRTRLDRRCRALGARVYAESTGDFVDRMEQYWNAWKKRR